MLGAKVYHNMTLGTNLDSASQYGQPLTPLICEPNYPFYASSHKQKNITISQRWWGLQWGSDSTLVASEDFNPNYSKKNTKQTYYRKHKDQKTAALMTAPAEAPAT